MTDPVKKYKELKLLTERIFDNLFQRVKNPPSVKQSDALKSYREKYQIRYKVVGSPLRKEYNAMDLIQAYKNGEIDDNTELVQVGVRNSTPAKFSEFKKYEPYKSELNLDNIPSVNFNPNIQFVLTHFPAQPALENKVQIGTFKTIAKIIKDEPSLEPFILIFDEGKYKKLSASSYYSDITALLSVV